MLVVLGFFVVFPLISIRFVIKWAGPPSWSVLLSVYANLSARSGYFRRRNCRPLWCQTEIVTGMLMRAAGFATMGIAHDRGYCGFHACSRDSAARCLIAAFGAGGETNPSTTAWSFFLLLMMQDSAGAVIGALLGSWRCNTTFAWSAPQGQFYLCCVGVQCVVVTSMETLHRTHARSEGMTRVMRDKRFVTYVLTLGVTTCWLYK